MRAVGRGDAAASRRARGQRFGSPRRSRAARSAGFEATGLVEPRPVSGSRGARRCTACCGGGRARRGARPLLVHACTAGRPGRRSPTGTPQVQCARAARLRRAPAELPRLDRATAARTRRRSTGRWGERDVADTAAGIRHAVKEGWCDAAASRSMGGSAGGFTALLVAAQHPDLVHGRRSRCIPSRDLLDLAATTHRFESGVSPAARRPAPGCGRRVPRSLADDARRPRSARRCCCCTATRTRRSRSCNPRRSPTRSRAAGTPVERHVYEGEGHGWRRAATVADELERVHAFLTRWVLPH